MPKPKKTTKGTKLSGCPSCFKADRKVKLMMAIKDKKKVYYKQPVMFCPVCSWFQWI